MNIDKKKFEKIAAIGTAVIGTSFAGMKIIGKMKKGSSIYNNDSNEKNQENSNGWSIKECWIKK